MRLVPTGGSALDIATLLPACRKLPLTRVLYSDAIGISGVPSPQCAPGVGPPGVTCAPTPGVILWQSRGEHPAGSALFRDHRMQPAGTIEREEIDVATDAGKYRGASRRADRHQRMRIPPFRIPGFLYFALSLSLKIVWMARSDQVQLPSVAHSPRAQHRLRRDRAEEVT